MALHGSAVLHTDCVYDDGVPEHTVVDAGPFRTTTTCTDLLPTLGTIDMYTVSSFLLRSARHLHRCTYARRHARTYRLHLHPSPALPATRAACRRAVGGRPVVRLSVSCAVCAALLLCGSCSPSCQCLPVASQCLACLSVCRPVCLSACLPVCLPVRLPAWPEPAKTSSSPAFQAHCMIQCYYLLIHPTPACPPGGRAMASMADRIRKAGSQAGMHTPDSAIHAPSSPPGPPSHDSQLRAEPLIPCVLV